MSNPEHLYHYTSIEGLAHILKSKQIRFSRLDLLDDATEGQSKDPIDWRKYFFVSCWTANSEESIPLWSMYTPDMAGVRLKLPTEMFKMHTLDLKDIPDFIQIADISKLPEGANISISCHMPYEKLHGEDYFVMPPSFSKDVWPFKVDYTNDEAQLNQNLISHDKETDRIRINTFEVAKYKKKVWEFQDEWRFRIHCHNAAPRSLKDTMPNDDYYNLMLKELCDLGKGISQKHFFMELAQDALDNLEVILGPKVNPAHKIIVNSLIRSYCPSANLLQSKLTGQLR